MCLFLCLRERKGVGEAVRRREWDLTVVKLEGQNSVVTFGNRWIPQRFSIQVTYEFQGVCSRISQLYKTQICKTQIHVIGVNSQRNRARVTKMHTR